MQILGLSDSTPKPENRLKSLFWPRVQYPEDVEYLGSQGFWVCFVVAFFSLLVAASGQHVLRVLPDVLYFCLAGVGIRQRSRFAAVSAFVIYALSVVVGISVMHSAGIASIFFLALLLSNIRGTWIAHRFAAEQPHEMLNRGGNDVGRKFADGFPRVLWQVGRWFYYPLAVLEFIGLTIILVRGHAPLPS